MFQTTNQWCFVLTCSSCSIMFDTPKEPTHGSLKPVVSSFFCCKYASSRFFGEISERWNFLNFFWSVWVPHPIQPYSEVENCWQHPPIIYLSREITNLLANCEHSWNLSLRIFSGGFLLTFLWTNREPPWNLAHQTHQKSGFKNGMFLLAPWATAIFGSTKAGPLSRASRTDRV